jgi:PhnB protein
LNPAKKVISGNPFNMLSINPYLNFPGTTEQAFDFYKSAFGGEFTVMQRFGDMPGKEKLPAELHSKIMHVALPIGNDVLMASDSVPGMGPPYSAGTNVTISINAESEEEAHRIFTALSSGGQVTMPLEKTFWNAYFGMLTDKFGIQWMINHDYQTKS